ncbi:hypothetical protein ABVB69_13540 [Streptomyces sp. NPDC000349]|uniref:hypothetical protein n=1 Tax=unclassified Streptomyces TaxID=2593676 RepID=UPI0027855E32|nr:hypothetical protein [Streptomyces sp. DSM 40167]MDQ0405357.1 hypothetical protein [Streptomyces sp. DSM 40167]
MGADAGLVVLTLVPALLSQPYVDTSVPAWVSLMVYEAVGVVVLLPRRRLPAGAAVACELRQRSDLLFWCSSALRSPDRNALRNAQAAAGQ